MKISPGIKFSSLTSPWEQHFFFLTLDINLFTIAMDTLSPHKSSTLLMENVIVLPYRHQYIPLQYYCSSLKHASIYHIYHISATMGAMAAPACDEEPHK